MNSSTDSRIAQAVSSRSPVMIRNAVFNGRTLFWYGRPIFSWLTEAGEEPQAFGFSAAGENLRTVRRYLNAVLCKYNSSVFTKGQELFWRYKGKPLKISANRVYLCEIREGALELIDHIEYTGQPVIREDENNVF